MVLLISPASVSFFPPHQRAAGRSPACMGVCVVSCSGRPCLLPGVVVLPHTVLAGCLRARSQLLADKLHWYLSGISLAISSCCCLQCGYTLTGVCCERMCACQVSEQLAASKSC